MVQLLARGMTSPLREMAAATRAMARGDYGRRVTATSRDEVGELARAFNPMAAELAEVDRMRRDLVANVSHELRTPITALQAGLENLVDGVEPPDPDRLRTMLRQVERLGRLVTQLLDLSKLESGAIPLQRSAFEVRPVLEDAADESRLHAPHVQVSVSVDEPGSWPTATRNGSTRWSPTCSENAIRHSPDRGTGRGIGPGSGQGPGGHRSVRRRAGDPRRGGEPGVRTLLPGRHGPLVERTEGPGSAWPSPAGSSTSTAATSGPSAGRRRAAGWSSCCRERPGDVRPNGQTSDR